MHILVKERAHTGLSCRCDSVTKLKLSGLFLYNANGDCGCPPYLLEAQLENAVIHQSWLNRFNEAAPNLEMLQLEDMISITVDRRDQLNPFSNLRQGSSTLSLMQGKKGCLA